MVVASAGPYANNLHLALDNTPTPRHSVFIGQMFFLTPSQQCQSTEVKPLEVFNYFKYETVFNTIILYPFNASV